MSVEKDSNAFPPIDTILKLGHASHEKMAKNKFNISNFRVSYPNQWWFYQNWAPNLMFNFLGKACLEFVDEVDNQVWVPVTLAENISQKTIILPGLKAICFNCANYKDFANRCLLMIRSITPDHRETFVIGYYRCAPGIMVKGNQQVFYMEIFINIEEEAYLKGSLSFRVFQSCKSLFHQLRALARIEYRPDLLDIFVNIDPTLFHFESQYFKLAVGRFNSKQKHIVRKVVTTVAQEPPQPRVKCIVVRGPPGTGKTHMLCGMIRTTLNFSLRKAPILVCASSNSAVDNVANKLLDCEDFRFKGITLARLGNPDLIHPRVAKHTETYLEHFENKTEAVARTQVLLCTLGSLPEVEEFKQFKKNPFKMVIFDEASQTSVPEALLISRFKFNLLVMVGDTEELPPIIFTKAISPLSWPSMLEWLMLHINPEDVNVLVKQYRMLPAIMAFPSEQFYGGSLIAAPNAGVNELIQTKKLRPYVLFKFEHGNEHRLKSGQLSGSVYNQGEAFFISSLASEILDAFPDKKPTMAIITFYEAQRVQVQRELENRCSQLLPFIDLKNVDSFLGQERDIVIVSSVRVDRAGFTASEQRTNVAITRAKTSLFVCSHRNIVDRFEPWISLFENAEQRQMLSGDRLIYEFVNASTVSEQEIRYAIFKP